MIVHITIGTSQKSGFVGPVRSPRLGRDWITFSYGRRGGVNAKKCPFLFYDELGGNRGGNLARVVKWGSSYVCM